MHGAHVDNDILTDDEVIILSRIAKARDPLSDFDVAGIMGWASEKARYHLEDLYKREYIEPNHMVTARHKYELLQKGRESLVHRGLL